MQQEAKRHGLPWTTAKGSDTFCPISNAVMKEGMDDANSLDIEPKVNGVTRQSSNTKNMSIQWRKWFPLCPE